MILFVFLCVLGCLCFFLFKQKTAYEMRISDWSSDVCSSDLFDPAPYRRVGALQLDTQRGDIGEAVDSIAGGSAVSDHAACDSTPTRLRQFHGQNSSSRLMGWLAMRASTSAGQAFGYMSFRRAGLNRGKGMAAGGPAGT